jgi:uncharacterized protein YndB with AHSA1/START domain
VSSETVTIEAVVPAPPERVAAAIASPQALGNWLCDEASSEQRAGGWLLFKWHDGRRRDGRWTTYAAPERLAWQWREGLDGALSEVSFELAGDGTGTRVVVTRSGVAPGDAEAVAAAWREHLADLATYLASGRNGRLARRPMLGIAPTDVTAELVAKHGLAVDQGIYLDGLTTGSAAATAGLSAGDVIVQLGEHPVRDWPSLAAALTAHRAGDTVTLVYWRAGTRLEVPVTLASRPEPATPADAEAARGFVRAEIAAVVGELRETMADITEAEAEVRPGPDGWSVREILAHLIISEYFSHEDLARMVTDCDPYPWAERAYRLRQRVIAQAGVADLLARFADCLRESEALALAALDDEAPPALVGLVARHFSADRGHLDEHLAQLRAARAAAGASAAVPA